MKDFGGIAEFIWVGFIIRYDAYNMWQSFRSDNDSH